MPHQRPPISGQGSPDRGQPATRHFFHDVGGHQRPVGKKIHLLWYSGGKNRRSNILSSAERHPRYTGQELQQRAGPSGCGVFSVIAATSA